MTADRWACGVGAVHGQRGCAALRNERAEAGRRGKKKGRWGKDADEWASGGSDWGALRASALSQERALTRGASLSGQRARERASWAVTGAAALGSWEAGRRWSWTVSKSWVERGGGARAGLHGQRAGVGPR